MSNYSNNQPVAFPNELTAIMNGSVVSIGTLTYNPCKLIFDNQGLATVAISVNDPTGGTIWRTFPPGEALVLDFDLETSPIGTTFYGNGASGTFSISGVNIKP